MSLRVSVPKGWHGALTFSYSAHHKYFRAWTCGVDDGAPSVAEGANSIACAVIGTLKAPRMTVLRSNDAISSVSVSVSRAKSTLYERSEVFCGEPTFCIAS